MKSIWSFLIFLVACQSTIAQTDFFMSFEQQALDVRNVDASGQFAVGDLVELDFYFTTNGPSDAEINGAIFLDFASSRSGVIEFTRAETFDYLVEICSSAIIGTRWGCNLECKVGQTGTVTDDLIDELHAIRGGNGFGLVDQTAGPPHGLFIDKGRVQVSCDGSKYADAFHLGIIDIQCVGTGSVEILMSAGDGGIMHDGQPIDVQFGTATIQVSLLGDVSLDGNVDLLDVSPFVELISSGEFLFEADINRDGEVNLLDVQPFIDLLIGN